MREKKAVLCEPVKVTLCVDKRTGLVRPVAHPGDCGPTEFSRIVETAMKQGLEWRFDRPQPDEVAPEATHVPPEKFSEAKKE